MNDYQTRWAVLASFSLGSLLLCVLMGASIDLASAWPHARLLIGLLAAALLCQRVTHLTARFRTALAIIEDLSLSICQIWALGMVFALAIYLAAVTGRGIPLQDDALAHWDALLGFQWDTVAQWAASDKPLEKVLVNAYVSATPEGALLLLLGSCLRPWERNRELIWIAAVGSALTAATFIFFPAIGRIGHLDKEFIDRLMEIRAGTAEMSYGPTPSIVCFPSFHTVVVVVFTYVSRHSRWALAACAALNSVMLLAIPPIGGHYLVDVLAGVAVALASIAIVRIGTAGLGAVRIPALARYRL